MLVNRTSLNMILAAMALAAFTPAASAMLHPGLGRFVQRDPLGFADGTNLYGYQRVAPMGLLDPSGMVVEATQVGVNEGDATDSNVFEARVTAKSFIDEILVKDGGVGPGWSNPTMSRAIFTWLTNVRDNPTSEWRSAQDFRLFSSQTFSFECCENEIIYSGELKKGFEKRWPYKPVTRDTGYSSSEAGALELGGLLQGTSAMDKIWMWKTDSSTWNFHWRAYGHPSPVAEVGFTALAGHRLRVRNIWHSVSGTISCRDGKGYVDASISGSKFPSHRLWMNGKRGETLRQGYLADLWTEDPAEPTFVE